MKASWIIFEKGLNIHLSCSLTLKNVPLIKIQYCRGIVIEFNRGKTALFQNPLIWYSKLVYSLRNVTHIG
jgi:hypothetical protein